MTNFKEVSLSVHLVPEQLKSGKLGLFGIHKEENKENIQCITTYQEFAEAFRNNEYSLGLKENYKLTKEEEESISYLLERVWRSCQNDHPDPSEVHPKWKSRNMCVGDIVKVHAENEAVDYWIVEGIGFKKMNHYFE